MVNDMSMTDTITDMIKELLEEQGGTTQIQRNEMAEELGCVPSQINYVITSRFTPEHGYIIESRRGGGGYIKIYQVKRSEENVIMHLINSIGERLDENSVRIILQNLCYDNFFSSKEAKIIMAALSESTLKKAVSTDNRQKARAELFKAILLNV